MKKVVLKIEGMSCDNCRKRLENYLNSQDGISKVEVNLEEKEATIECNDNISINELNGFVSDMGFSSSEK